MHTKQNEKLRMTYDTRGACKNCRWGIPLRSMLSLRVLASITFKSWMVVTSTDVYIILPAYVKNCMIDSSKTRSIIYSSTQTNEMAIVVWKEMSLCSCDLCFSERSRRQLLQLKRITRHMIQQNIRHSRTERAEYGKGDRRF